VREADILLHVVDISHPAYEEQMGVVNKTLQDLKAFDKPIIVVFNKMDLYEKNVFDEWLDKDVKKEILEDLHERWERETEGKVVFISAIEKRNLELLRKTILDKVREVYKTRYPYKTGFYPLSP
jgi:GTP-binding protein HflX